MTKDQHFVPRFYLRKFTDQRNLVEVLDLTFMKLANPTGVRGLCCEEFFYGIVTGVPDETSQRVEEWFKKREDLIGENLDSIVDKILNNEQIEPWDKWIIALLMSMLWIRGQEMRNQIHRIEKETTKWMIETEISIQPDRFFSEYELKNGVKFPPELRAKMQEMMVKKEFEINPNNSMHLKNLGIINDFAHRFYFQSLLSGLKLQ